MYQDHLLSQEATRQFNIGTPVYVYTGYDVTIDCNIVNGTPPITIQWFRNGSPDSTRGNVSTITITDANNGDVFQCRADNIAGFDTENTVIHVEYGKCECCICLFVCIHECVCVCVCVCVHACKAGKAHFCKAVQTIR